MDILELDALELSGALDRREVSAADVMQATLARIEAANGQINAVVSLADPEALMREARAADAAPRRGWLHGVPFAVKDLANVAGFPTSRGSPLFAGEMAAQDDPVIARLREAGAIFIGKTNTPEFGLGSHTFNPVHGATRNPYNSDRSAGGSSGGAAAALAARMVCVADGSDMMGSLRNPAGWNNVYGMRPTWGSLPGTPDGDLFMHPLAMAGPMARSPRDLAALLDTMSGPDPWQPLGVSLPATLPPLDADPGRLRLGWLGDWGGAFACEEGILALSRQALVQFQGLGHSVSDLLPPFDADLMWDSWLTLRAFANMGNLKPLYDDPAARAHLKDTARWEVEQGLALDALAIHRASLIRSDWQRAISALFEELDVLVLPSAQCWPFDVTLDWPREVAGHAMDTYHRWMQVVVPASLLGLPVVNVPAGFGAAGLPAGLQLIGPRGSDGRLLQLAQHWHEATRWPQSRPPAV